MMDNAARRASEPHLAPVPDACYLCKGGRLRLRHRARGGTQAQGAAAYNCTSFGHRSHPPIWGCEDCGMMFQWPLLSPDTLLQAYQDVEDPLYVAEKDNRYHTFRRVLRELGRPRTARCWMWAPTAATSWTWRARRASARRGWSCRAGRPVTRGAWASRCTASP
ncbi:hypothetical protein [Corallococcus sp. M7]